MMRLRRFPTLLLALFVTLGFAACDSVDAVEDEALLRFQHASPDAGPVDVLLGDDVLAEDLDYGETTDFFEVESGTRAVAVRSSLNPNLVPIADDVLLLEDRYYTIVAAGELDNIAALVVEDDEIDVPDDESQLRLLHGAATAPAVDAYVLTSEQDFGDVTPVATTLAFGDRTPYLDLREGTYRVVVTPAGQPGTIVLDETLDLDGDTRYLATVTDPIDGAFDVVIAAEED